MIFKHHEFTLDPSPQIGRARQILIKPCAGYPTPYPVTTSRETLERVITAIRKTSEADIIILDGSSHQESMFSLYQSLSYDFPRVLTMDVRECVLVEVENPLLHPFAVPTFWLPNLVLYCDYLISIAPFKVLGHQGSFSIYNLLSLLPVSKYQGGTEHGWGALYSLGIQKVLADLYFTLPFDLGIIDAKTKLLSADSPSQGEEESYGKIFVGEPYAVDKEATVASGVATEYLTLIETAKSQFEFEDIF